MDKSSYLDPSAIQAQCESAIQILNSDISALQSLDASLNLFTGNNEIWSFSFATLKQQIRDYTTITQAICMAHESDKMDYEVFKQAASQAEGVLDGEVIIGNKEEAERQRKSAEENRDYYNSLASRCFDPTNMTLHSVYIKQASFYQQTAWMWQKIYDKWQKKEDNYDEIEGQTGSLFTASPGMRAAIESAIAGIKGSFRVAEGKYVPDMNALWRRRLEDGKVNVVKQQLLQLELNEDEIQSVTKLGFTYDELWSYRCVCETPQDKEFFKRLLIGTEESYIKAFQINPNEVSDMMCIFMADYGYHLLELDSNKQITQSSLNKLMILNNTLLDAEYAYMDEQGNLTDKKYRDVYLNELNAASQILLLDNTLLVASISLTDERYDEFNDEYLKNRGTALLWSTEAVLIEKMKLEGVAEDLRCNISELKMNSQSLPSFQINHYSPREGEIVSQEINTQWKVNGNEINSVNQSKEYRKIHRDLEMVYNNMAASIVMELGIETLGYVAPPTKIITSLAKMGMSGSAGTISGIDSYLATDLQKNSFKAGNIIASETINALQKSYGLEMELEEKDYERYLDWVGSGGTFMIGTDTSTEVIVLEGEYNPDLTRIRLCWEEEGIGSWFDEEKVWDIDSEEALINSIENSKNIGSQVERDAITLIRGEKDMIKNMPTDRFNDAISAINTMAFPGESKDMLTRFIDAAEVER